MHNTIKLFAATTIAAALVASPSFAKDEKKADRRAEQSVGKTKVDRQARTERRVSQRTQNYRQSYAYDNRGYGPGRVAAGIVGGAVATAGAIAAAPFGGYDDDGYYANDYRDSYAYAPGVGVGYAGSYGGYNDGWSGYGYGNSWSRDRYSPSNNPNFNTDSNYGSGWSGW